MALSDKILGGIFGFFKQPLDSYCDLETVDGTSLLTSKGEYITLIEIHGSRRMFNAGDVDAKVERLRLDIQSGFEFQGHGLQAWFATDPGLIEEAIATHLAGPRATARELDINLDDILNERARVFPKLMRWERCFLVVWSRRALLTRDEEKIVSAEQAKLSEGAPSLANTQNIFLATDLLSTKHTAFVSRVVTALRGIDVACDELDPREALRCIREAIGQTIEPHWRPFLPGDPVAPHLPDDKPKKGQVDYLLWPTLASQLFADDAGTEGMRIVTMGAYEWTTVEITVGPEDARSFSELVARMAASNIPWRMSMWIEGGGAILAGLKSGIATMLAFDPTNRAVMRAFQNLRHLKETTAEVTVRWRCSFATWAPRGERATLRRQAAVLAQRVQAWGNCNVGLTAGDPLEALMGSALGLSFGSTSPSGTPPVSQALKMLPWGRPASAWRKGSVLFRSPDGRIAPYDPSGSGRGAVFTLIVAPPRFGKSTLANAINLGLCLSTASQGTLGAKLPLIGKIDIGDSAEGFVLLLRNGLPPERQNEAIYVRLRFRSGYEYNPFDLQLGCRHPLPLERSFLINFLSLATLSQDASVGFEGMNQFIGLVIDEAYRMFSDIGENITPKVYVPGTVPEVDAYLATNSIRIEATHPWWWEIVDVLCARGEYQLAALAQRHAVPILEDLISAARADRIRGDFSFRGKETSETLAEMFERYIKSLIREIPTLNKATSLDFGPARVIVLDLQEVAPSGSADADRKTALMYMLARHIIGRNFFLHPDYLVHVPQAMKAYHTPRFREFKESVKRLDYDEYHRTKASPFVRAQVVRDLLEGGKHNVQIVVASQSIEHFDDDLIRNTNEQIVLGARDDKERETIIKRFQLSEASAFVLRNRLTGPDRNGGGAPFLMVAEVDNAKYEQMMVNSLGPIELWALSTTPLDVHLRTRLYAMLGPAEARRRLALVFPNGSAEGEIRRRRDERLTRDADQAAVEAGVTDELAQDIYDGRGIAIMLRGFEPEPVKQVRQVFREAAE